MRVNSSASLAHRGFRKERKGGAYAAVVPMRNALQLDLRMLAQMPIQHSALMGSMTAL